MRPHFTASHSSGAVKARGPSKEQVRFPAGPELTKSFLMAYVEVLRARMSDGGTGASSIGTLESRRTTLEGVDEIVEIHSTETPTPAAATRSRLRGPQPDRNGSRRGHPLRGRRRDVFSRASSLSA